MMSGDPLGTHLAALFMRIVQEGDDKMRVLKNVFFHNFSSISGARPSAHPPQFEWLGCPPLVSET